jgi:hypothetical protein
VQVCAGNCKENSQNMPFGIGDFLVFIQNMPFGIYTNCFLGIKLRYGSAL